MDTILEILIDNSNSMGPWKAKEGDTTYLLPDGSTRMELAKKILIEEIIPKLDYASTVTIRKFHAEPKTDRPIVDVIYNGQLSQDEIILKINDLEIPTNTGGTPITAAVKASIDELAKYSEADRKIILVTDGEENGGGDYKVAVEEAFKQHGISCNIFIVGISQDEKAQEKSAALTQLTGGHYVNLKSKVYDKVSLQTALQPFLFKAVNTTIENVTSQLRPADEKEIANDLSASDVDSKELKSDLIVSEAIQSNSKAIGLLSRQLLNLTEAVAQLRNNQEENSDEVLIEENAELNEKIRLASEGFLFTKLKEKFGDRIKWKNDNQESGSSYDFEVIDTLDESIEYYIECKASMYSEKTFLMTIKEWIFFLENKSKYQVYFVANALTIPQITKIDNLMEALVSGKVIPYSSKNIRLKKERIVLTIVE